MSTGWKATLTGWLSLRALSSLVIVLTGIVEDLGESVGDWGEEVGEWGEKVGKWGGVSGKVGEEVGKWGRGRRRRCGSRECIDITATLLQPNWWNRKHSSQGALRVSWMYRYHGDFTPAKLMKSQTFLTNQDKQEFDSMSFDPQHSSEIKGFLLVRAILGRFD